jgi:D-arginine dehydrogenase
VVFAPPPDIAVGNWPLVASQTHSIYFAPEAGDILLSPMDEDPMEACDPSPDEEVIARGIERFGHVAPPLLPRSIKHRWSGLRTFAPDRVHVVGPDPLLPGFFWLAGQGGCGIETSPLVGRIAAELIVEGKASSFDADRLAPARFA